MAPSFSADTETYLSGKSADGAKAQSLWKMISHDGNQLPVALSLILPAMAAQDRVLRVILRD